MKPNWGFPSCQMRRILNDPFPHSSSAPGSEGPSLLPCDLARGAQHGVVLVPRYQPAAEEPSRCSLLTGAGLQIRFYTKEP